LTNLLLLRFRAARSKVGRSIGKEKGPDDALILIGIHLASALGGPISGLILNHTYWFGLDGRTAFRSVPSAGPVLVSQHYVPFAESSWRWLLILEGSPAVTFAFLVLFLLPSRPAEARFLTAEEKAWIAEQLER
jgi:ACS family tartrate transporter-like MFS transporter